MAGRVVRLQITTEGGDASKRQFDELAKAGRKAFADIQAAAEKTKLGAALSKGIKDLRRDLVPVGAAFSNLGRSVVRFGARIALLSTTLAGVAAGVVKFTFDATAAADEVGKAAQGVGLASDEYQRLQFAAEQAAIEQSAFVRSMTRFNKVIGDAADGNAKAVEVFERLGVNIFDANGNLRSSEAILRDVADAFSVMREDATKTSIGAELFGRRISEWLPLLNEGGDAIKKLGEQFDQSIGGFTEEQIKVATQVNDAWNAMARAARSLRQQIGVAFAPSVLRGIEAFHELITRNRAAIIEFAKGVANRAAPVIADLFNVLIGSDAQVVDQRFIDWRDGIVQFGQDVRSVVDGVVVPAFRGLVSAADDVATAIRTVTGGFVDFTGRQALILGTLIGLTGGFRVLRDMIRLTSAALVLLARHPIVAGFLAIAGVTAHLATRQTEAGRAAEAHKDAMLALDDIMRRVRAGVAGATEELAEFRYQQIRAGEAALQNARDQIKAMETVARAEIAATVGPTDPATLDAMIAGDPRVQQLNRLVAELSANLEEARAKFAAATVEAGKSDREMAKLGRTATETGREIEEAGEQARRAFPGPAANIRSVQDNPFAPITEGAREAGDESEASGRKIQKSLAETNDAFTRIGAKAAQAIAKPLKDSGRHMLEAIGDVNAAGVQLMQDFGKAGVEVTSETARVISGQKEVIKEAFDIDNDFSAELDALGLESQRVFGTEIPQHVRDGAEKIGATLRDITGQYENHKDGFLVALKDGSQFFVEFVQQGAQAVSDAAQALPDTLGPAFEQTGRNAATSLTTPLAEVGPAFEQSGRDAATAMVAPLSEIGPAFEQSGRQAAAALTSAVSAGTAGAFSGIQTQASETAGALPGLFQTAASGIASQFSSAFATIKSDLAGLVSAVQSAIAQISAALSRVRAEIARTRAAAAAAQSSGGGGGGGGGAGFAGGGLFRGRRGRDKNLAFLSDYEYVMNPAAVRHFGVQFMHAINNLRMPKFAAGGLNLSGIRERLNQSLGALAPIPTYAVGGLNVAPVAGAGVGAQLHPVTINIPGGPSVSGLLAPPDVIGTLERYARRKAHASAGRKQEFVR